MAISNDVSVVSLGGTNDVGERNCYLVTRGRDGILLDYGQKIPDSSGNRSLLGPEYFPAFEYIRQNGILIHGVVLTHAHLDHAGGIPRFFEEYATLQPGVRPVVYGSHFTNEVVRTIVYQGGLRPPPLAYLEPDRGIQLGPFAVHLFPVTHSVPGSMGVHISVEGKSIVYLGDWKLLGANGAENQFIMRMSKFAEADALLLDATNAYMDGVTLPESVALDKIIQTLQRHASGTVLVVTFSSHGQRISEIIQAAEDAKRPVYIAGTSLIRYCHAARIYPMIYRAGSDGQFPHLPSNAVILSTGVQAEPFSILPRVVSGDVPLPLDGNNDAVIVAGSTIPKPEIEARVRDLMAQLAEVATTIYLAKEVATHGDLPNMSRGLFHVSGHGRRGDIKTVLDVIRPRLCVPVHADLGRRSAVGDLIPAGTSLVLAKEEEPIII